MVRVRSVHLAENPPDDHALFKPTNDKDQEGNTAIRDCRAHRVKYNAGRSVPAFLARFLISLPFLVK